MASPPIPLRDFSILNNRTLGIIKARARPPVNDTGPDEDQIAQKNRHEIMAKLVTDWPNTINRNRQDRQTRLQREADAQEKIKIAIDEEEKKVQKLKRQAALAEAKKSEFAQRPEVRAVNAQLLLHEVQLERAEQEQFKEQRHLEEMRKQINDDDAYRKKHEAVIQKEAKIREERKKRAIETAADIKTQKEIKEAEKKRTREEEIADEKLLIEEMKVENENAKVIELEKKRLAHENLAKSKKENEDLQIFKAKMAEIESREDERIRQLAVKTMDEEDERRELEARHRQEKLNARQSVIEAEAKRQMATKKVQEDFLEKQLEEDYQKEKSKIEKTKEERKRLQEERRRDYLATKNLAQEKKASKKIVFPAMTRDGEAVDYDIQKKQGLIEIADFQARQIQEKKEKEAAEKEREKLEFLHSQDLEKQRIAFAQEYAAKLLNKAHD